MTFAEAAGLALATAGLSILAVAIVGALRHWNRAQLFKVASGWGIRLWGSLVMLTFGIGVLVVGPLARTGIGGLLLIVLGGVSMVLVVRALPGAGVEPGQFTSTGALSPRAFDYLIWVSLGLPMVGIGLIVIAVLLGAR